MDTGYRGLVGTRRRRGHRNGWRGSSPRTSGFGAGGPPRHFVCSFFNGTNILGLRSYVVSPPFSNRKQGDDTLWDCGLRSRAKGGWMTEGRIMTPQTKKTNGTPEQSGYSTSSEDTKSVERVNPFGPCVESAGIIPRYVPSLSMPS